MLRIALPIAAGLQVLAHRDAGHPADHSDEIAMTSYLHLQDGEAGVVVVEGDPLHETGERFSVCGGRAGFVGWGGQWSRQFLMQGELYYSCMLNIANSKYH